MVPARVVAAGGAADSSSLSEWVHRGVPIPHPHCYGAVARSMPRGPVIRYHHGVAPICYARCTGCVTVVDIKGGPCDAIWQSAAP